MGSFISRRFYGSTYNHLNAASKLVPGKYNAQLLETTPELPCLTGGGGGIFFFWQMGALQHLRKHYDLERVQFIGASAGALSATIAACNVDTKLAVDTAYRIAEDADIFDKKLGLLGIWGGLIRQWLEEILPQDAHILSRGRLKIVAQDVWRWRPEYLQDFHSREELISANMASIHIPFFLNFRLFSYHKERALMDADLVNNMLFWGSGRAAYVRLMSLQGRSFMLNHRRDTELVFSRLDMLKGRKFAARIDAEKGFDCFLGNAQQAVESQGGEV